MTDNALHTACILLPRPGVDMSKWAVVACDQFTAQPDYWRRADALVGEAPSALRLILPEAWLSEGEARTPAIHAAMADYLRRGVLVPAVEDGFVLIERETPAGVRPGLVVALDLEAYDFAKGSASLIRATEGTVLERVPPRARIRTGAPLELPHVMMLIDDPGRTVIEPLLAKRDALRPLYDFELMLGGGHLRGWAVEGADLNGVFDAVDALNAKADGLLYAVGDGNHSLAAAKRCWQQLAPTLSPEARERHPARFALVELVNLACPALVFEPIHRALFGVDPKALIAEYRAYLAENGADEGEGDDLIAFDGAGREWRFKSAQHPLRLLQAFLDGWLARHPGASIDYIHGEDALRQLVCRPDTLGFMPRAFDKGELFGYIRRFGVLPRKTFSMGEATEKRYYVEARRIL
ncbi:MAG: DUF1015 domain-containing protein [Clostridia bacterium]|nr:DUF1015 domain-containing protein [Clostridia bacterium]